MYVPTHFRPPDESDALRLIDAYPFATVITVDEAGEPFISHLPLLLERATAATPLRLSGHLARANPHARLLHRGAATTAVFHGPHAYVTPRWYAEHDVPTWNYAVVHARGAARLIEDERVLVTLLTRMRDRFEGDAPAAWRFALPQNLRGRGALAAAIVGVEITIDHVQAKLKLSQNRSLADRQGVAAGLAQRPDDASRDLLQLMAEFSLPQPARSQPSPAVESET